MWNERASEATPPNRRRGPLFGVALLLCLPLSAQNILVNSGGPATGNFTADTGCNGGAAWGPAQQPSMAALADVYQTLRYGPNFTCSYPVASAGLYAVTILLLEPNKTAIGQRVFTITINGQQTAPLDLFALTGGQMIAYEVDAGWIVADSLITVSFRASVGNAVVSAIMIRGGSQPIIASTHPCSSEDTSWWLCSLQTKGWCAPVTFASALLAYRRDKLN